MMTSVIAPLFWQVPFGKHLYSMTGKIWQTFTVILQEISRSNLEIFAHLDGGFDVERDWLNSGAITEIVLISSCSDHLGVCAANLALKLVLDADLQCLQIVPLT